VSRVLRGVLAVAVLATGALVAGVVLAPGRWAGLTDAYLLVLGVTGAVAGVRATGLAFPPARPLPARQRPRAPRPVDLRRAERQVEFATQSALDAHRLRLALRRTAAALLAARHGIDLDADHEAAEAILGPWVWKAVGVDPARRPDRDAPPLTIPELRAIVEALERV